MGVEGLNTARVTRRNVLKGALVGAAGLGMPSLLTACGSSGSKSSAPSGAPSSGGTADWKQFSGTTINFISENTSPSAAIAADSSAFTNLTGIKVQISQMELGALVQKVALDFGSGRAAYDVIYADPYQVLAPYVDGLVDLNTFMADKNLPQVPQGIGDFISTQLRLL